MNFYNRLWKQRIGYGVADTACNLVWQMATLYLMFFYTDVMGLPASSVGIMFLVTRLVDGVTDIAMGMLIDNTNTRWGKSRPYFLWGAIPFGIIASLTFYVPDFGPQGRLMWAYATYMGLSLMYTVVNIPLASILPALTDDAHERTMLATTRIVFSFIGATIISVVAMPMVDALGNGDTAHGYFVTMAIWSTIASLLFLFTFKNVEEKQTCQSDKISIKDAYLTIKQNKPWFVFAANIVLMWGSFFFQSGALIYYVTYNLGKPELISVIAGITAFVPLLGTLATPLLSSKMKKITVFLLASSIIVLGMITVWLCSGTTGLMVGVCIIGLGLGLRTSIYFSMQADPVDYGQWKTGINAAGLISAINGFIGKVSFAIAGAVTGYLLSSNGYVPGQVQSTDSLLAIEMCYLFIPMGLVLASILLMKSMYKLDYLLPQINADLLTRAKKI